jgi:hypothetical protein
MKSRLSAVAVMHAVPWCERCARWVKEPAAARCSAAEARNVPADLELVRAQGRARARSAPVLRAEPGGAARVPVRSSDEWRGCTIANALGTPAFAC